MRRTPLVLLAATAAGLAVPGAASADVYVDVPTAFLGGPIWNPLPAPTPEAAGRPSLAPPPASDPCRAIAAGDCAVVGAGAEVEPVPLPAPGPGGLGDVGDGVGVEGDPPPDTDTPGAEQQAAAVPPAPMPAAPPATADLAAAFGDLVSPRAADWLAWQRPTLRWRARAGAGYYNVQIFRGPRRVLNAWSTDTRLRVPEGVLRQGRSYVWVVWPAAGRRSAARYGTALGRSTFAITLRPRIVFHRPGRGAATVGEIRPHIPFATLRLTRPGALARRVPQAVTLDRRGRFVLPISTRAAERLGALLTDRGPNPPVGLRGPGL
jgi:hypothetical protein